VTAKALFQTHPSLEGLPIGSFRYASQAFVRRNLPAHMVDLFEKMSEGIEEPRLTYHFRFLWKIAAEEHGRINKSRFGHGRWHCDGREDPDEIHRLLTIGGVPTLGRDGTVLHAGTVWEYSGAYEHRAQAVEESCWRLMMRVSETNMIYRNHWSRK